MASDDQKGDNLGLTLGLGTLREKEAVIRLRRKAGELVCVQPHNQKFFYFAYLLYLPASVHVRGDLIDDGLRT